MTIKMFIMFIIGDTTLLLLDLCVTLGWAKIATIVVICCHVVPEASSFFLQQKPDEGNYQSINFTDSKFWGRGLRGDKKGTCLEDRASHIIL